MQASQIVIVGLGADCFAGTRHQGACDRKFQGPSERCGELCLELQCVADVSIQAPLLGIGRYLESGALVELLPDFRHRPLDVALVVAHRRNLSRRVRAFMKWIENVLAPYLE
jgi:DNA-binding transcriptional LysR family regulator